MCVCACVCESAWASEGCGKRDDVEKVACRHFHHGELLLMCLDCFSTRVSLLSLAGWLVMLLHWKKLWCEFYWKIGSTDHKPCPSFPSWAQTACLISCLFFPAAFFWLVSCRKVGESEHRCERSERGNLTSHMWMLGCVLTASTIKHAHDITTQICFERRPFMARH